VIWRARSRSPSTCVKRSERRLAGAFLLAAAGTAAGSTCTLVTPATTLEAKIAATPSEREHGLMGRVALSASAGMLFVFEHPGRHCFWMKNTPLPLAVVFLDDTGRVLQTEAMQPFTTDLHCAEEAVRLALEVTADRLAERGIVPGARLDLSRCARAARR
jgi:hypothetical protein